MLTQLLRDRPDVAEKLTALVDYHPNGSHVLPIQAYPQTANYALVGTALDYLIRWELERRNPAAHDREWVATTAVNQMLPLKEAKREVSERTAKLYRAVLAEATALHAEFIKTSGLLSEALVDRAARTVLALAKIDPLFRTGKIDDAVNIFEPKDAEDVKACFAIAPWKSLGGAPGLVPILNPDFGSITKRFKGADADLVIESGRNGILIDFKCSKYRDITKHFPQLVGYGMIIDLYRAEDPNFPAIARAGIYFARHGEIETFDFDAVRASPSYTTTRDELLAAADEMFAPKPSMEDAW